MNARKLFTPNTPDYYLSSSNRITIHPSSDITPEASLLRDQQEILCLEDPDIIFMSYAKFCHNDSGFWEPDLESPFYNRETARVKTTDNLSLFGKYIKNDRYDIDGFSTSIITFYGYFDSTNSVGWARDIIGKSYVFVLAV